MAAGAGPPQARRQAESELTGALRQLFAVVENYPDLKANQNFLALQEELTAHREQDRLRAAVLQRQRDDLQHARSRCSPATSSPACSTSRERQFFEATTRPTDASRVKVDLAPGASDPGDEPPVAPPRSRRDTIYEQIARNKRALVAAHGRRRAPSCSALGLRHRPRHRPDDQPAGFGLLGVVRRRRHRLEHRRLLRRAPASCSPSAAPASHPRPGAGSSTTWSRRWRSPPACRCRRSTSIDDPAPNAFATGRDPQHAVDRGHEGLLADARPRGAAGRGRPRDVARPQLRHPLHDAGRHRWSASIALLADFFLRVGLSGAAVGAAGAANDGGGGGAIMLIFVAPRRWPLLRAAARHCSSSSRSRVARVPRRRFGRGADAQPASAWPRRCEKIAADPRPLRDANRATAHLYIANPLRRS